MKLLDSNMGTLFQSWVDGAPDSYKLDGFLTDHIPIGITSIYGQNQPLPVDERHEIEDARNWGRARDFKCMKYVSFALASHVE